MSTTLDSALVADLAGQVSGSVLGLQDAGHEAARAVHNVLIDRSPALIVRCRTTNDVVAALARARRAGREVSIRGGGHNVASRASTTTSRHSAGGSAEMIRADLGPSVGGATSALPPSIASPVRPCQRSRRVPGELRACEPPLPGRCAASIGGGLCLP